MKKYILAISFISCAFTIDIAAQIRRANATYNNDSSRDQTQVRPSNDRRNSSRHFGNSSNDTSSKRGKSDSMDKRSDDDQSYDISELFYDNVKDDVSKQEANGRRRAADRGVDGNYRNGARRTSDDANKTDAQPRGVRDRGKDEQRNDGANRSTFSRNASTNDKSSQSYIPPKFPEITQKSDGEYLITLMVGYLDARGVQKIIENLARTRKNLKADGRSLSEAKRNSRPSELIEIIAQIESDLQTLLKIKNIISSIIGDKVNFDHPFFEDTLLTFFYMLSYVDTERLKETALLCKRVSSSSRNEDIRDLGENLEIFCDTTENLIRHLEELMSKSDKNLLQQIDGKSEEEEEITESASHSSEAASHATEKTDTSLPNRTTAKSIPERWPYLANLLEAFKRYASVQPRRSLSTVADAEELMRSMLTNLRSIERKNSATTKAIPTIEDARDEFTAAMTSRKIRLISNIVAIYNKAVTGNSSFDTIADNVVSKLKTGVFLAVFDELIEKLEKIKEEGKLRGRDATAVEDAIDNIDNQRREFRDDAVSNLRKRKALETAFTLFNNAINALKNRESSDESWTELKEKLTPISVNSKNDTLNAYKEFAEIKNEVTDTENKKESTISRSSASRERAKVSDNTDKPKRQDAKKEGSAASEQKGEEDREEKIARTTETKSSTASSKKLPKSPAESDRTRSKTSPKIPRKVGATAAA